MSACGGQEESDDLSSSSKIGVEKTSSSNSTQTTEQGGAVTVNIRLTSIPLSTVTIFPTSSDSSEGSVSPSSFSFTNQNWNSNQTLTITGVDDNTTDGTQSYKINFALSTEDYKYSSVNISALTMTNKDDEVAGVLVGAAATQAFERTASDAAEASFLSGLGATISTGGKSLGWYKDEATANQIAVTMAEVYRKFEVAYDVHVSKINRDGIKIL